MNAKREKLNFAIIGCGKVAPKHAEGIKSCMDAQLYAVCDIVEETARNFALKYNVERYFTDYKKMLELREIDVVCICTPSGLHAEMAIDCARARKHVLCEKPLAITKDQLNSMIKICEENNVKLGAIFQNRTFSGAREAKRILEKGSLGKIYIADGYCKEYRSPEYYKSASWRGTWALDGGGCLMNQGIHCVDTLCWLAGPAESVIAKTFTKARDIEVEDCAFALIKFKNGAFGVLEGSTISTPGREEEVEIQCEKGRIIFYTDSTYLYKTDETGRTVKEILDREEVEKSGTGSDPTSFSARGHKFLVADMARAVIEDRDPYITGKMARHAVDVILAIYKSSVTGKEVLVSED